MEIRYKYSISRTTYSEKMLGTIAAEPSLELKSGDPTRLQLLKMLSLGNNDQQAAVVLKNLFPKFLKVSEFIFVFLFLHY